MAVDFDDVELHWGIFAVREEPRMEVVVVFLLANFGAPVHGLLLVAAEWCAERNHDALEEKKPARVASMIFVGAAVGVGVAALSGSVSVRTDFRVLSRHLDWYPSRFAPFAVILGCCVREIQHSTTTRRHRRNYCWRHDRSLPDSAVPHHWCDVCASSPLLLLLPLF